MTLGCDSKPSQTKPKLVPYYIYSFVEVKHHFDAVRCCDQVSTTVKTVNWSSLNENNSSRRRASAVNKVDNKHINHHQHRQSNALDCSKRAGW